MAVAVLLRGLARRSKISTCLPSYESLQVFRNVNTPMIPWAGFPLNLGSRALCSKPDHNDLAAQNETKILSVSNPTSIVFKYVCDNDEPQEEDSKCFKIRKMVESPTGDALFEYTSKGGDTYLYNGVAFLSLMLFNYMEAAESFSGRRVKPFCVVTPSLFKQKLDSLVTKVNENVASIVDRVMAGEITKDSSSRGTDAGSKNITSFDDPLRNLVSDRIQEVIRRGDKMVLNSYTGRILLTLDFDDFFEIRIWEIITNGDKTVLEIIVGDLKRNGFDLAEDPLALQKVEQAVERAIARGSNAIKLNLPVPAGHPEVSTTVSWGTSDDSYERCNNDERYPLRPW